MSFRMHKWMAWMPALTALAIPMHPRLSSITLLLWVLSVVAFEASVVFSDESPGLRGSSSVFLGRSGRWFAWGGVGLYLLYGLGLFWTERMEVGRFAMEGKFSLLLIPLLTMHHVGRWGREGFAKARQAFWLGLIGFVLWRASFALFSGEDGAWRYDGLAGPFHPTYMGMYLTLGVILSSSKKHWNRVMVCLAGVFVGLLASKAAWLVATCAWGAEALRSRKMETSRALSLFAAIVLLVASGTIADEGRMDEFRTYAMPGAVAEQAEESASTALLDSSQLNEKTGSSGGRMQAWKASVALMQTHAIGVGTGDVADELCVEYERLGARYALKKRMNPHSVWLQLGVSHGVLGLAYLLIWIGGTAFLAARSRQWILVLWLGIWAVNGAVESLLELQQGVVPTMFLTLMLSVLSSPNRAGDSLDA